MLHTSVYYVPVVEVADGVEDLPDGLRSVLLCELALFADAIEKFTASGEFGDNVPFILYVTGSIEVCSRALILGLVGHTLDSNQSTKRTM